LGGGERYVQLGSRLRLTCHVKKSTISSSSFSSHFGANHVHWSRDGRDLFGEGQKGQEGLVIATPVLDEVRDTYTIYMIR